MIYVCIVGMEQKVVPFKSQVLSRSMDLYLRFIIVIIMRVSCYCYQVIFCLDAKPLSLLLSLTYRFENVELNLDCCMHAVAAALYIYGRHRLSCIPGTDV